MDIIGQGCPNMCAFDEDNRSPRAFRIVTMPVCVVASSERGLQIWEKTYPKERREQAVTQLDHATEHP